MMERALTRSMTSALCLGGRLGWCRRDVIVCGKKRTKRKAPPKFHKMDGRGASVAGYLEFGDALGLSVEESLEKLKNNPAAEHLLSDPETQKLIKKLIL